MLDEWRPFLEDLRRGQFRRALTRFIRNGAFAPRVKLYALSGSQPLKVLEQFGGLDAQRHRQVLGSMKLLPLASRRESA